jgi:hypothetical protein
MTFDDFPTWLKAYFQKVGAYIEAKGSSNDIGITWLEPFIDQATSDAAERAKWVVADPDADDLGGSNLFIRAIEAGYYKNGPYTPVLTTFYEDQFMRLGNITGTLPSPTPVGTNTYSAGAGGTLQYIADNTGQIGRTSTAGVAQSRYDLGQAEYTLTLEVDPDWGSGVYVRYLDNSNFYRIVLYTTGSTDEIESERRFEGSTSLVGGASSTGIVDGTSYLFTITVASCSMRFQVAAKATSTTFILDETIVSTDLNTNTQFVVSDFRALDNNTKWRDFVGQS